MSLTSDRSDEKVLGVKESYGPVEICAGHSDLQAHFLNRLEELLLLTDRCNELPKSERWLAKVLARTIYSTFRDCAEQGVIDEAKALLTKGPKAGQ